MSGNETKTDWENAELAEFLSLDEYIEAINLKVYRNKNEERYLRIKLWWAFNDRIRDGKQIFLNAEDEKTYELNCKKLIELMDKNTEAEILMCAELYRNIGNYIECINVLETLDKDDYPVLKNIIEKECENKNKYVILDNSRGGLRIKSDPSGGRVVAEGHKINKGQIRQLTKQAEELLNNGQYDEALGVINDAINIEPESAITARAYCMRSKIFYFQGNLDDAKRDIKRAIKLNPTYKESYHFNAEIRVKMLFVEESFDETDYGTIFELCQGEGTDEDFDFLTKIGDMFTDRQEYEKANKYYARAINDINIYISIYKIDYYRESYNRMYNRPFIYTYRGMLCHRIGKFEDAKADFCKGGVPGWFGSINPQLQKEVIAVQKEGYSVRFTESGNGEVIFGDVGDFWSDQAFDAKTGELVWMS